LEIRDDPTEKLKSIENKTDVQELNKLHKTNDTTILKFFTVKMPPENF